MNRRAIFLILFSLFGVFSLFALDKGVVEIYVFTDRGLPLEGVETEIEGETYTSDESGFIQFVDEEGTREYDLYFEGKKLSTVTVPVRARMAMEVMITVSKDSGETLYQDDLMGETAAESDETGSSGDDGRGLRQEIDDSLPKGTLSGTVRHIETDEEVTNATVIFRGITYETVTDDSGSFTADVPEGIYSISIIHPDYSTRTIDSLEVVAGDLASVEIVLTPSAITLEAVTVFASVDIRVKGGIADLIDETKNSGVVLNLIGAEQISSAGDSDAAGALKRVTGLTVVDGRYVYVRGMGERYSASYLNGARLPSPEIDRRVVPLDLFPTSVIESMAVQKSYSPDIYGDFGGGTVSLRTKGIPEDRYQRRLRQTYNISIGYDMDSTFTEQIMDTAGSFDWLGIDDGGRAMPNLIGDDKVSTSNYSDEDFWEIAESMPQDWDGTTGILPPDISFSAALRDKVIYENGSALGWNLSLMYKNGWDTGEESITNYANVDAETIYYDYDSVSTSHDVDIGILFDLGYSLNDNISFESTSLLVRTTDSEIENYIGNFTNDSLIFNVYETSWVESTLFSQRLGGKVGLEIGNEPDLNWQYTFSIANRYEPSSTKLYYQKDDDADEDVAFELYDRQKAAGIFSIDVLDIVNDLDMNMEIPFFFLGNDSADYLDVGIQAMYQNRTSDVRRFYYGDAGNELDYSLSPDELFVDEYIEQMKFGEYTEATDNYSGYHFIGAFYADTDMLLLDDIRINAGVRGEYSSQIVQTFYLFGNTQSEADLTEFDLLPSVNCTIPFGDGFQLRVGGSRTVNRPDLRELSDAPKYGVAGSGVFTGNPDLERAVIWNTDTRLEYYIAEKESLSLGAFYKDFTNAIELVNNAGAGDPTTLANVPSAVNIGGEFEWQLSLRYVSDWIRSYMMKTRPSKEVRKALGTVSGVFRDLTTSGNFSYIYSQIDYEGEQGINTNSIRPLQGQSPWIINANLGYKNSVSWSMDRDTHTSIFLNYNVFGPRISQIGVNGSPDYYEQPFHQLDLVAKHSFNEFFSLGLKVSNILDPYAEETVGDLIVNSYQKGRSFSLSAKLDL